MVLVKVVEFVEEEDGLLHFILDFDSQVADFIQIRAVVVVSLAHFDDFSIYHLDYDSQ